MLSPRGHQPCLGAAFRLPWDPALCPLVGTGGVKLGPESPPMSLSKGTDLSGDKTLKVGSGNGYTWLLSGTLGT